MREVSITLTSGVASMSRTSMAGNPAASCVKLCEGCSSPYTERTIVTETGLAMVCLVCYNARSKLNRQAGVAQSVEQSFCKLQAAGSNPAPGSRNQDRG